jgi:hypothetical protein
MHMAAVDIKGNLEAFLYRRSPAARYASFEDHNCWTIAEAVGHRGPHRLQHLLSRAVWDDQQHVTGSDLDAGLIPITVPELLRLLRDVVIPPPRRDRAHRLYWSAWRRRHQHLARQAHQRWNAYAETTPCAAAS